MSKAFREKGIELIKALFNRRRVGERAMDISLKHVEYRYQANTPFERLAIKDVSIDIPSGTYMAIIGHTGSGKSTVLQHLNALVAADKRNSSNW